MSEITMFSILFALVGLLFVGISIPLILGSVPPSPCDCYLHQSLPVYILID